MSLPSDTMNANNGEIDIPEDDHFDPAILDHAIESDQTAPLTLPPMSEIVLSRDDEQDSVSHTSSDGGDEIPPPNPDQNPSVHQPAYINPASYISNQFYTFNPESHTLMIRCILDGRLAFPNEIRAVTSNPVLTSWRTVWKDRNENTAFVTAWKRIQEKLVVIVDTQGNEFLSFKSNSSNQFLSHFNQWQDIVMSFHSDADLKHLCLKETIEKIKQVWTVGAKFYGIPESFIRACISVCPVCLDSSNSNQQNKRKKFEYTEAFELPAKDVPFRLQQLAAKHKVVLCIRQKYIRHKPIMAEVKDYACHRAGEPVSTKKSKMLNKEPYTSKRCGCSFRIRAIVPIANYNEKDKSFVYQEEGLAMFMLFAVHSGHEPGPLDGHARIIHRGLLFDHDSLHSHDIVHGMNEETGDLRGSLTQQVQELKNILGSIESGISMIPDSFLSFALRDLSDIKTKLRTVEEYQSGKTFEPLASDIMVGEDELADWDDQGEDSFGRTLGNVVAWDDMRVERVLASGGRPEGWLNGEESKLGKPVNVGTDGIIQVDNFYQDNAKWYDSTCGLDPEADCGDSGLRGGAEL